VAPATSVAAVVPGMRATVGVAVPLAEAVEKTTWGTVTAVEMTVVVEEDGMTEPLREPVLSVQGTVTVVWRVMVVTGVVARPRADAVAEAEADGTTTDEAPVTMAGLPETWGAQIPWKYFWAASMSDADAPYAERHPKTLETKVASGQ
jgi:hypothetical protein